LLSGRDLVLGSGGLTFSVASPWGKSAVESGLIGRFNASNLLATLGVLLVSGVPLEAAAGALGKLKPVAGRTERYGGGRRPVVIVDYAHTPDALENVLRALRELMEAKTQPAKRTGTRKTRTARSGRLVCVFGCGGDRDRGKRPLMGRIASRLADEVIVTSDNPRSEEPRAIIDEIVAGVPGDCEVIEDRKRAIHAAVTSASAGDVVLIAGKGHEQYQEVAGVKHPHSDAAAVREALGERSA
jgi:UDP-N-acetylmuramoyl-L-alanyl-D-glutamate--2,6-diaminopimelate ligase